MVALNDVSDTLCVWGGIADIGGIPNYSQNNNQLVLEDLAGNEHTQAIRSAQNGGGEYAAGLVDFDNGWYLPTVGQLFILYGMLPLIETSIINAGGIPLKEGWGLPVNQSEYWSSVEGSASQAWCVSFYDGRIYAVDKNTFRVARAVRSFSYYENVDASYLWNTGDTNSSITVTPDQTTAYTVTVTTSGGCADTVEHTITVLYGNHSVFSVDTCGGYLWHGTTYTESGTYTYEYTNADGCLSADTLHLTIIPYPELSHTPDTTIIAGTSANLWASGADILYWTDSGGNILTGGSSLMVSPEAPTMYYLTGQNYGADVVDNLVENGDFEQGNVGFGTDYVFNGMGSGQYGHYTITTDGILVWGSNHLYGSGATGQFMLVDGAITPNATVWQQTVSVTPNTYYVFSAQVASTNSSNLYGAYALLQFSVNGTQLGPIFHSPSVLNSWQPYYEVWYSGNSTSAILTILNQNSNGDGNDFGLDDIVFTPISSCQNEDSVLVNVMYIATEERTVCEEFEWNGEIYTETGDYEQHLIATNGCDSMVTLHLTVNYGTHNVETETACESYTWHGETYTSTGIYTYDYTNFDGCASTDTLHLTINYGTHNVETETVCESYTWHGETYTTSGTYTYDYTNADGCASTDTLHLTVNHGTHNVETEIACESYTWHGETYTSTGTYTYDYTNVDGCSSTDTLHLTVNHPEHQSQTVTAYDTYTWTGGDGQTYNATGTYSYAHTDANGCTQVDTLHLTVYYSSTNEFSAMACESYDWDGRTYTTSGDHEWTYQDQYGADSVVTLHLTVTHGTHDVETETACESYEWHGMTCDTSGTYTYEYTNGDGCPSVDTLHFTRKYAESAEFAETACEIYEWNGVAYTESGDYPQTFIAVNGCDSVVTLHLTVNYGTHNVETETACESYTWHSETYTSTGTYTYDYTNIDGCSSIDTLHLTINYGTHNVETETVCESYTWHGETCTSTGTYTYDYTNDDGCSSTDTLHLTVNHPEHQSQTVTAYDTYTWTGGDGQTYNATGTYYYSHTDANGCTQVDTLHLTVYYSSSNEFSAMACESYDWDGRTYTTSGDHEWTYQDQYGADSVVTLHLTITHGTHQVSDISSCESYEWHGLTCDTSGTYTYEYTNGDGCPSADTLYFTRKYAETAEFAETACESYEWNGTTYTESGDYSQTFTAASGCDSVVTLHLTVNHSVAEFVEATACESYTWNDSVYTASGDYLRMFTAANGCDSVITLHLTVNQTSGSLISASLVENSLPCMLNGSSYMEPGTYYQHFTNAVGCDSTLTLQLTVYYNQTVAVDSTVCGDALPVAWNDSMFTSAGTKTRVYPAANGADSIVVMTLHVNPSPVAAISGLTSLCADSVVTLTADSAYSYLWSTGDTTQAISVMVEGFYTLTVTNEYGCDAVTVHQLSSLGNPILSVTAPDMCAGGSYTFSVGHQGSDNIHLGRGETTLSLADTVFLPDGVYCEPQGCSYRSPLTFTAYAPGSTIQSADDIHYVRLNMEHSYIGDLYINITCPNGQKADLLKYGGSGSSECNNQIPASSRGWAAGDNMPGYIFLGNAYDYNVNSCDPSAFGNEPGEGWNYCWSDNTTQGYTYSIGAGGYIYRFVNATSMGADDIVDSSDVAAGTQFYHPDDPFSNLIGCPLNGPWYIEVQDGWSSDNGYIFGWELALSSEMLPDMPFELAYATADGPWITALSDSLFQIDPPTDLDHDTTIVYTFTVYDTTGCAYDTTVSVNFYAIRHTELDTVVCEGFVWNDSLHTTSGQYVRHFVSAVGCDSVSTLNLTVNNPTDTTVSIVVLENALPYQYNDSTYVEAGTYTQYLTNVAGCDSVLTVVFDVIENVSVSLDSTICESELPVIWNDSIFTAAGTKTTTILAHTGADSTITMTLTVIPTTYSTLDTAIVENALPCQYNEILYFEAGTYTQYLTNSSGCDSILTLTLTVYPNVTISVDSAVCENTLPFTWNGVEFLAAGTDSVVLVTATGADSTVVMTLQVYPVIQYQVTGPSVMCMDSSVTLTVDSATAYLWSTGDTTQSVTVDAIGYYSVTVTDGNGCTTIADHYVTGIYDPIIEVDVDTVLCVGGSYTVSVGYQPGSNILLGNRVTTLSLSDTIFLPDGFPCSPYGCSYQSPLTFTAYAPGDTIESADDIYYVRLNMEHSWIGDLYINITCPNGQKADLLKYGGNGTSECNSSIVPSSRGWQSGVNMDVSAFLGNAYDYSVSTCDATAFGNEPGAGWNYCWSNNTTQGYTYAPGAGSLIYRSENEHNGIVDSSNVAAGTHFYHPDDSFSNLIGCPLNGSWYIEVMDGWSVDNGYIFGWELALSSEALPEASFVFDYSTAQGPWVTAVNDSMFLIQPPADFDHDTTIIYTFTIYDTSGCAVDTAVAITFLATINTEIDTAVCESFVWNGVTYTASGEYPHTYVNVFGCDSVVTMHLTVNTTTYGTFDTAVVENALPCHYNDSTYIEAGTYTQYLTNAAGCDSILTLNLVVYNNVTATVDTTVCAADLPYTWHGHSFTAAGTYVATLLTSHGADSVVTYHLSVDNLAASIGNVTHITCYGESTGAATATITGGQTPMTYAWTNASGTNIATTTSISNRPAGTYTFMVTDHLGCTATATVTINALNGELQPGTIADNQDVCDGEAVAPFTGTAASGGNNGAYQWQISTNGTDWTPAPGTNNAQPYTYPNTASSAFTLRRAWVSQSCGTVYSNTVTVNIWPNSIDTITAIVCQGENYNENNFDIPADQTAEAGEYTFEQHHATSHCDSAVILLLTVNPTMAGLVEATVCEGEGYNANGFTISPQETIGADELTRVQNLQAINGCDSVVTLQLTVIDTALRLEMLTDDFCEHNEASLTVLSPMPDYVWSTGETATTIVVTSPGIYSVTASEGGCSATAHIRVEGCHYELVLPNAITPSRGDGLNDCFYIPEGFTANINLFKIYIYNRWGELVFYSTDKNFRWYGEYRGKTQYQTIYNYVIEYTDMAGRPAQLKGSITVL